MHIFDWYFSGTEEYRDPRFRPEPGTNREEVERLFADSGAFIFGRRTCEITNGWGGRHPVGGAPVFVLTQPAEGVSQWPVATDLRHRRYRERNPAVTRGRRRQRTSSLAERPRVSRALP
jgi:hypothetical protein